jgi:hypothetical protein
MKIQTISLTDTALDWAVATSDGLFENGMASIKDGLVYVSDHGVFKPSLDWAIGGPIIQDQLISIVLARPAEDGRPALWYANKYLGLITAPPRTHGPTALVAAMRCFVQWKMGDEVEVPDDLVGHA